MCDGEHVCVIDCVRRVCMLEMENECVMVYVMEVEGVFVYMLEGMCVMEGLCMCVEREICCKKSAQRIVKSGRPQICMVGQLAGNPGKSPCCSSSPKAAWR